MRAEPSQNLLLNAKATSNILPLANDLIFTNFNGSL